MLENLRIDEFVVRETWKIMSHSKGGDTPYIQVQNKNILYKEND